MDTEEIAEHARRLTRDGFVFRFANLFLAVKEAGDEPEVSKIRFETKVVDFASGGKGAAPVIGWEIFEVVKAPGNPYPERISLGRARNCDLVMRDSSVSKLHAHFRVKMGGGFELVDLESQNGTRLNGVTLLAHQPHAVGAGDEVQFGAVVAKVVDAGGLYDLLNYG